MSAKELKERGFKFFKLLAVLSFLNFLLARLEKTDFFEKKQNNLLATKLCIDEIET